MKTKLNTVRGLRTRFGQPPAPSMAHGWEVIRLAKILVPTDFSEESRSALKYARAFAGQFGAAITLLHVVEPVVCQADYGYGCINRQIPNAEMLEKAKAKLSAMGRKLAGSDFRAATIVRTGVACSEIIQAAKDAEIDLIVMGTHGNNRPEHAVMDSTAERVVRDAPCPVFVVRKQEHEFVWFKNSR